MYIYIYIYTPYDGNFSQIHGILKGGDSKAEAYLRHLTETAEPRGKLGSLRESQVLDPSLQDCINVI